MRPSELALLCGQTVDSIQRALRTNHIQGRKIDGSWNGRPQKQWFIEPEEAARYLVQRDIRLAKRINSLAKSIGHKTQEGRFQNAISLLVKKIKD